MTESKNSILSWLQGPVQWWKQGGRNRFVSGALAMWLRPSITLQRNMECGPEVLLSLSSESRCTKIIHTATVIIAKCHSTNIYYQLGLECVVYYNILNSVYDYKAFLIFSSTFTMAACGLLHPLCTKPS